MGLQEVKEYFGKFGREKDILEFTESSSTVELAAKAIGTTNERIAKTMALWVDESPILILCAGDARIDNHKYKEYFKNKAKMLTPDELIEYIGHPMGGVCPFGVKSGITVYLDISLKRFDYVYPACGSGNSAIKLTISEIEEFSNYKEWIDVCKLIEKQD